MKYEYKYIAIIIFYIILNLIINPIKLNTNFNLKLNNYKFNYSKNDFIWGISHFIFSIFLGYNFSILVSILISLFTTIILKIVLRVGNWYDLLLNITGYIIGHKIKV